MPDVFDPAVLLDTEYTGDLARYSTPCPEGVHMARVKDGSVNVKKGVSKAGNAYCILEMLFCIEDEEVKKQLKRDLVYAPASIFLDLTPSGQIATKADNPDANTALGRLKSAMGFREGKAWKLRNFEGMSCYVKVVQETNPDDIEDVRAKAVAFYKDRPKPRS
jgi:hypothetical protein